ncbi:hypothetical protein R1sor_003604 [Riccia sorocarpa]|uniref:diacylglycerol O-acyltransferase n=1 Tax=Riccia sorocarpa TaxID=122646 RepID=A0ABD3H503_9MARC
MISNEKAIEACIHDPCSLIVQYWHSPTGATTNQTAVLLKADHCLGSNPTNLVHRYNSLGKGSASIKRMEWLQEVSSGDVILHLSEGEDGGGGHSWVEALKSAGCRVATDGEEEQVAESITESRVDGDIASSAEEVARENNLSANSTPGLRHRKYNPSFDNSTGATSLPQEGVSKTGDEKKFKEGSQTDVSVRYTIRPSCPAHKKIRDSLLSSDEIFNQSHAGLCNLCIVCLIAVNGRLIIENLMKFSLNQLISSYANTDCLMCIFNSSLLSGFILIIFSIVSWMKLISYAHTNSDARTLFRKGEKVEKANDAGTLDYPDNITVKDIAYFMFAPKLCYQRQGLQSRGYFICILLLFVFIFFRQHHFQCISDGR